MKEAMTQNKFNLKKAIVALILSLFVLSFVTEFIFIGLYSSLLWVLVFAQGALIAGFVTYFLKTKENPKRTFLAKMFLLLTLIGMILLSTFPLPVIGTVLGFTVTVPFLLLPIVFSALALFLISQNQAPKNHKKWITNTVTTLTILLTLLLFFPNPLSLPIQLMGLTQLASIAMQMAILLVVFLIAKAVSSLLLVLCQRQNEEKFANNTLHFIAIFTNYLFPNLLQTYQNAKTPADKRWGRILLILNISSTIASAIIISNIALSSFSLIPMLAVIIPTAFITILILLINLVIIFRFKKRNIENRDIMFLQKLSVIDQKINENSISNINKTTLSISNTQVIQTNIMNNFIKNFYSYTKENIIKKISNAIITIRENSENKENREKLIKTEIWPLIVNCLELRKYKFIEKDSNNSDGSLNDDYLIPYRIIKSGNGYLIQFYTIKSSTTTTEGLVIGGFPSKLDALNYITSELVWVYIFETDFLSDNYFNTDYLETDYFDMTYTNRKLSEDNPNKLNNKKTIQFLDDPLSNNRPYSSNAGSQLNKQLTPEEIFWQEIKVIEDNITKAEQDFVADLSSNKNKVMRDFIKTLRESTDSTTDLRKKILDTFNQLAKYQDLFSTNLDTSDQKTLMETPIWPLIFKYLKLEKYKFREEDLNKSYLDNHYLISYQIIQSNNTYLIQVHKIKSSRDKGEGLIISDFPSRAAALNYIDSDLVWLDIFETNLLSNNNNCFNSDYLETDDFDKTYTKNANNHFNSIKPGNDQVDNIIGPSENNDANNLNINPYYLSKKYLNENNNNTSLNNDLSNLEEIMSEKQDEKRKKR